MTKRGAAWCAGVGVVLSAVSGALINQLGAGWAWWPPAGAVVLAAAVLAGRQAGGPDGQTGREGPAATVQGSADLASAYLRSLGTQLGLSRFEGRERLIADIDRFMSDPRRRRGWVVVEGEP